MLTHHSLRMIKAFFDGLAAVVGFRVGGAVLREAERQVGRARRERNATAKAAFLDELEACTRELPGGTPATAIVVEASSVIEPCALKLECLACDEGRMAVAQHRAETVEGVSVRVVDLECRSCGSPRRAYFRIDRAS